MTVLQDIKEIIYFAKILIASKAQQSTGIIQKNV